MRRATSRSAATGNRGGDAPPPTAAEAYQIGLRLAAARELTAAQLRQRLARRGVPDDLLDPTLDALREAGALDDVRAARAKAHHDIVIRRLGRTRALRQVEALGVDRETAREAVDRALEGTDEDERLREALARRLRGRPMPTDPAGRRRLSAWLFRQGFDSGTIRKAMSGRGTIDD